MTTWALEAQEIIKNSQRGVRASVELGQVTGNENILNLLMLSIVSGIEDALSKSHARGMAEAYEDAAKVAEGFKFKGDFEACPAAWVNACYDKFEKAIRQRAKERK